MSPLETAVWPCLDHDHVLGLLDYFADERYSYFVSRYSETGDVMSWLSAGKSMSSRRAKRWLFQVVTAMRYLKELGFVHGDIKFENLLIENDRIKLCDFGCVQRLQTNCTRFYGTVGYLAPEVIANRAYDTEKADVWSLGVVAFKLLCPHEELFSDIDCTQLKSNWSKSLPTSARPLVESMLQLDPDVRPDIDQIWAYRWFDCHRKNECCHSVRRSRATERTSLGKRKRAVRKSHSRGYIDRSRSPDAEAGKRRIRT